MLSCILKGHKASLGSGQIIHKVSSLYSDTTKYNPIKPSLI